MNKAPCLAATHETAALAAVFFEVTRSSATILAVVAVKQYSQPAYFHLSFTQVSPSRRYHHVKILIGFTGVIAARNHDFAAND